VGDPETGSRASAPEKAAGTTRPVVADAVPGGSGPSGPVTPATPPKAGRGVPRWVPVVAVLAALALAAAVFVGLRAANGGDGSAAEPDRVRPTRSVDPDHTPGTLFVSPEGSDDAAGTEGEPLGTLGTALARLQPGDTLVVADGEYRESLRDLVIAPGQADRRIRVEAAPGANPVLVGHLWLTGADYWDVTGLDVRWDSRNNKGNHMVKFIGGTGWTLTAGELSRAKSYAALLISGGANKFTVSDMYIHDTRKANGRNQDHLVYVNTDARGGVIERNVLVGSPNGRAIKVGPPEDGGDEVLGNVVIRYNTMVDNRGPSNVSLSYNTSGVKIYRNIMVDPDKGMANVTAKDLSGSGNRVWDNVIFGSEGPDEPGTDGLEDGGGNVVADPDFTDPAGGDFHPRNPKATGYGAYAPGS
jgi:hypothetical protein